MSENKNTNKSEVAKQEEEVLKFWQENKIFEKSLKKKSPNGEFVFYDGPPFATGLPHYGHLLAGTIKDIIPRYQTMLGKKVSRRWGWDCHGLPIENLIEKEFGLKTKQDIYDYGVEKFNESAKESVLRYDVDWKKIIPRTGRWVDMNSNYQTMDTSYSESIWWIFKNIYDKDLIYEGHKAMHLCPRCETTLSNFEVNQGYKDIKDLSVTVKFELKDTNQRMDANNTNNTNKKTYVLAWTTTPWTLPGNVALAVGKDIDYIKIESVPSLNITEPSEKYKESKKEFYWIAKEIFERKAKSVDGKWFEFEGNTFEKTKEIIKGSELIGKSYKPIFDYYANDETLENRENGWKIYGANFVTTEDGTGVVHIAPAFGSDDMELRQKENLPFIQHVSVNGKFKDEVKDFAGLYVKPKDTKEDKDAHIRTDIEIIRWLQDNNKFFSKEKIEHSYPHCWRCHTPLINYATSSWFLKVTGIKDEMIKVNKTVNWVPENMREGRFGKWLEGARDWAISRTRFWGAPLPVWKCNKCEKIDVLGSLDDLKNKTKSANNFFVMRHGEAENNTLNIISTKIENAHHLTEKGKKQILGGIDFLKNKKIDLIISSPFTRTKETTKIIANELKIKKEDIIFDERLKEVQTGDFEGKNIEEYRKFTKSLEEKFIKTPPNGENLTELKNRVGDFVYDIDKKYSDKNILIVTHEYPAWLLLVVSNGLNSKEAVAYKEKEELFNNADIKNLNFAPLPHNKNYELDLHIPYIDEVKFNCECGGEMKRIPEVFDCWFESGAMPYASNHYPFENLDKFNPEKNIGFPADFIAEGQDQTRGWFYTSLVLSTALFGKTSYKNVIVNGMILAEDGRKMSKSLKNYPSIDYILNKYGADAMRYYLISSPVVRAEDLSFSEKGVDEVLKKIILKVKNVYSFYELYEDTQKQDLKPSDSPNILDKWILSRLNQLNADVFQGLNNYELDKASRPILGFVEDLSTWYIRRSRDRFKMLASSIFNSEKNRDFAIETTRLVLKEFSKIIAPFMPFLAEEIYQKVSGENGLESVHLENWTIVGTVDKEILENMAKTREIISLVLDARVRGKVNVRQPLYGSNLKIPKKYQVKNDDGQWVWLIMDEANLFDKNGSINFVDDLKNEVELKIEITPELKAEGNYRELLRNIQKMRKEKNLVPSDIVDLIIFTSGEGIKLVEKFKEDLKKVSGFKEIKLKENEFVNDTEQAQKDIMKIKIDDLEFGILIIK